LNCIVIATTPGREEWLSQCLKSLGNRDHIVISDFSWELGKIKWMYDNTSIERWLFLQDSIVIKDEKFFDLIFSYDKSVAVSSCPVLFGMYLGIYHRETLSKINIPKVKDKEQSIFYEHSWNNEYCKNEKVPLLFKDLSDSNSKGQKFLFGRNNLILENDYLIKYKGTWR
jgi:hypothetical protein